MANNNKYPRLGSSRAINGGKCVICGQDRSDLRYDIEVNYMRGDDEVFSVHRECVKDFQFYQVLPMLKNNIKIVGVEWADSYLHNDDCKDRKAQVLNDLKERIKKGDFKQWDIISIDCKDHSSCFELFQVVKIISWCNIVLNYQGGGS